MKFRKLSLLLIPALLMSCGSGVKSLSLDEARIIINNFKHNGSPTYTHYSIDAEIQIAAFPIEDNSYQSDPANLEQLSITADNNDNLSNNITNGLISSSYYLGAPLKLDIKNFFKEKGQETTGNNINNVDKSNCVYGIVHSILIFASGSTSSLAMEETETGGIIFSVTNSDTFLTIANVNSFPALDIYYTGNFAGRINGQFEYNNQGYLVREEVSSIHYDKSKAATDGSMMHLISEYSYS